jgi:hypothetical protein
MNDLIEILKARFHKHPERHPELTWEQVEEKLSPKVLRILEILEESEGEPDIVGPELQFIDCSAESPKGRRSLCYDQEALEKRKEHKPNGSAVKWASDLGVRLLTEEEYIHLQSRVAVDQKTSSWLLTPKDIREKGGAIFGDKRYGRVFIYHNGADSYYAARAFRCILKL